MKRLLYLTIFIILTAVHGYSQCWQQISAGSGFSVGIKTDGSLWAWGDNQFGQLGIGNTTNQAYPVKVGNDYNWYSVVAGYNRVFAIKLDGTLWGWGDNNAGRIGAGIYGPILSPVQIGTDTDWDNVSPGGIHTIATKINGTLWGWGDNSVGQLGLGSTPSVFTPQQIGTDADWVSVSAGILHTVAIKNNGTLWTCGYNNFGELGTGDNVNRNTLTQIGSATDWQKAAAGYYRTHAIKTNGTLWGWGRNDFGQLGIGTNSDVNVPVQESTGATNWASVSSGQTFAQAIKSNNTLWFWGYGYAGDGGFYSVNVPQQSGTDTDWQTFSAKFNHSLATKTGFTAWAWGENYYGELGDGTTNPSLLALQVTCSSTLPVTWLYVNGQIQNGQAFIKWATASETNTDRFEAEHSTDGIHYVKMGTVQAAGNSYATTYYEFVHPSPVNGKNFYRIKQIDLDGRYTYSSVVLLQAKQQQPSVIIAPNPVKTETSLYFSEPGSKTIRLFTLSGQLLYTATVKEQTNRHIINLNNMAPGVYLLKVSTVHGTSTQKIIKH